MDKIAIAIICFFIIIFTIYFSQKRFFESYEEWEKHCSKDNLGSYDLYPDWNSVY